MFSAKELSIPFLDDPSPLAGEGQLPAARLALPSHLGRFAAQTYGAGAEVRVTSRQGLVQQTIKNQRTCFMEVSFLELANGPRRY